MAVTIQYKGKLRSVKSIDSLVAEVQDICKTNKWLPDAQLRPFSTTFPLLRGLSFRIQEGLSSLDLYFNKNGILFPSLLPLMTEEQHNKISFLNMNTQFLGPDTHIKIINLLTYLDKKYFETFELKDNGGYYPTQNRDALIEKFNKANETLNFIVSVIKSPAFYQGFTKRPELHQFMAHLKKTVEKKIKDENRKITVTEDDLLDAFFHLQSPNKNVKK